MTDPKRMLTTGAVTAALASDGRRHGVGLRRCRRLR